MSDILPSPSNDGSTPVSQNWLSDIVRPMEKEQKFEILYRCREEILDKYFGKPLNPEFLDKIKKGVEKVAEPIAEGEKESSTFLLLKPNAGSDEFFSVEIATKRYGPKDSTAVYVRRHSIQNGDPKFDEPNFVLNDGEAEQINFGPVGENNLPLLPINNNPSNLVTADQQAARLNGGEVLSIQERKIRDMESEFIGLCNSQGVKREDLEKFNLLDDYPIPDRPGEKIVVGRVLNFSVALRTPRDNHDDVPLFNMIEKALESRVKMTSEELEKYKSKFVEEFEKGSELKN